MFKRSFYTPKDHSPVVEIEELGLEVYTYKLGDRIAAMGFSGKRQKPDFHYTFGDDIDRMEIYIANYVTGKQQSAAEKKKRAAERKAAAAAFVNPVKVGMIFVSSWGYDQTRNYFYQVTKVTKKMAYVKEIGKATIESTGWNWTVIGVKDSFKKERNDAGEMVDVEAQRYLVKMSTWRGEEPIPYLSMSSYESAYLWDGSPCHDSGCH